MTENNDAEMPSEPFLTHNLIKKELKKMDLLDRQKRFELAIKNKK